MMGRLGDMQCLAPLDPRDLSSRAQVAARAPRQIFLVTACALCAAFVMFYWRDVGDLLRRYMLLQFELGVVGVTTVAVWVSRLEIGVGPITSRHLVELDAMYEEAAAAPESTEAGFTHYLPCVMLISGRARANVIHALRTRRRRDFLATAIGGKLYLGPRGVEFRPTPVPRDGVRRRQDLVQSVIPMGSVRSLTASTAPLLTHAPLGLLPTRRRFAMLVDWGGAAGDQNTGQAVFAVPSIGDTMPRLNRTLDELRWGARA